tara:strand:- start:293 stop:610 length:318 start_codon:yes stop_codon:yes gene_type:complete
MIKFILLNLLLTLPILALAQSAIPKVGNKCPSGYQDGKGAYCYNSSRTDNSKTVPKTDSRCPGGYRDGKGAYCYGKDTSQDVITKVGNKCPSGYRDGKGAYCYGR